MFYFYTHFLIIILISSYVIIMSHVLLLMLNRNSTSLYDNDIFNFIRIYIFNVIMTLFLNITMYNFSALISIISLYIYMQILSNYDYAIINMYFQ